MRLPLLASLFLATAAVSQSGYQVGFKDVAWINTSGQGSPYLHTRVLYPSPSGGQDAPVEPNPSGWPVIVFLHGFGLLGRDYSALGEHWSRRGFAVALVESAMFSFFTEVDDGRAQYAAIVAANRDTGTFFAGAFDTQRIAIAGHSMGGGAMALILANNPGYRCAFAIAPAWPGTTYTSLVDVPCGIVVGTGDIVTPWDLHAHPYFSTLAPLSGLKFLSLQDLGCDHMNIAGFSGDTHPAFVRTATLGLGFFRHFLDIDAGAIEQCVGPVAISDPHTVEMATEVAQPRIWAAGRLHPGRPVRISVAAEVGLGAILVAPTAGWHTPTPFGTLLLDPSTVYTWTLGYAEPRERRIDATLQVPNDASLIGTTIAMQGIGATNSSAFALGSATEFVVQ